MQQNERESFVKVLMGLAAVKPGAKLTVEAFDMWWSAFSEWSLEDFQKAAAHLVKTTQFMPTPYDFEQLRKAGRMTAGEAFIKAMAVARQASSHGGNTSGDPIIDRVANACGGYFAMGMNETEKLGFLERRFAEHYESISDAEEMRDALPDLTLRLPPTNGPRRIGDLLPTV